MKLTHTVRQTDEVNSFQDLSNFLFDKFMNVLNTEFSETITLDIQDESGDECYIAMDPSGEPRLVNIYIILGNTYFRNDYTWEQFNKLLKNDPLIKRYFNL